VVANDRGSRREERDAPAASSSQGIVGDEVRLNHRRACAAHLDAGAAETARAPGPNVPGDLVVRDQRRAEADVDADAVAASVGRDEVGADDGRGVGHEDAAAREAAAVGDGEPTEDRATPFAGVEGDDGAAGTSIDDRAGWAGLTRQDDRLAREVDPFEVRPGRDEHHVARSRCADCRLDGRLIRRDADRRLGCGWICEQGRQEQSQERNSRAHSESPLRVSWMSEMSARGAAEQWKCQQTTCAGLVLYVANPALEPGGTTR